MQYRTLGRTGLKVSAVGLGAWQIGGPARLKISDIRTVSHGWGTTNDDESVALIDYCRDAGVNFIDTAPIYGAGHSEEVVGRALRGCRNEWIVCTKGGHGATNGATWYDFSKARLLSQIDESLARLRMEAVDVYLLHGPTAEDFQRGECLDALSELKRLGKARFVGVSIGPNEMGIELMRRGAVDVLQQGIGLIDTDAVDGLLKAAIENNVGIVARNVFGGGFLAGKVTPETPFSPDDRRSWQSMEKKRALYAKAEALRRVTGPGCSVAQLALRYVLQVNGVSTAILGTSKREHMQENIAALNLPELTPDELRQVADAVSKP